MTEEESEVLFNIGLRLRSLRQRLQEANAQDASKANQALVRLARAAMQLHALVDFVEGYEPLRAEYGPLKQLNQAMLELLDGRKSPLFEDVLQLRSANRPAQSLNEEHTRSACGVALELLMKIGRKKSSAARIIADRLNKSGFRLAGGKPVNARTVISWRDNDLSGAKGKVSELAIHAESEMKRLGHWPLAENRILQLLAFADKPGAPMPDS